MTWLGGFHKLKKHHLRLRKWYPVFDLREHSRHFLNDATANKLEKFLRMDDFELTNDFFSYCDLIAKSYQKAQALFHRTRKQ